MNENIKKWFFYSVISIVLGCFFGYGLVWLWFFVTLIFFRSGDSGPAWVNMVNNIVLYGGIIFGIIIAEILFVRYEGRHRR
jgi:hypothetical protein